jgi:hypothetical protein
MKVNFFTLNDNDRSGSYRIWVKDLSRTFNELNLKSKIKTNISDIDNDIDVLIICKSAYKLSKECRAAVGSKVTIGAINIDRKYVCKEIDFVIVGSPEEYASISSYKNVFIYPLIERKFEKIDRKIHTHDNDILKICFHGHYPHLFKFEPFLREAIEIYDKNVKKIELNVITGYKDFDWKVGKPNVKINMFDYNDNITNLIKENDIGVVPNVSDVRLFVQGIEKITDTDLGLYETDYFMRYKNKTNAGRSYVFYQHGIPVIHDLSPSSFELMKITGYHICAHDTSSWFRELKRLTDFSFRESMSKSYFDNFRKHYDPLKLGKILINNITEIKNEKNS